MSTKIKNNKYDSLFDSESNSEATTDKVSDKSGDDFGALLRRSEMSPSRKLSVGDKFTGEILSIGREEAFISTGSGQDAVILLRDLLDEKKLLKYKVGEMMDVVVTSIREGEIRVSKKGSTSSSADLDSIEDAFDMELPVEGRVKEVCNGGFRVTIMNKTAFCPISQLDSKHVEDANEYVGKKFEFLITQFSEKGRNIVVSRRRILDLKKAENEGAFMQIHQPGTILNGKITRLEKFGAFVEMEGGVEGLIHISEIGWSRINHPSELVQVGMSVQVKLLKIEDIDGRLKISFSLKQGGGEGDPWMTVPQKFPKGTILKGKVEKKEPYGLFVNIAPGITGLLPRSKWRDSLDPSSYDNKNEGD